jgi:hypothetical protein
MNRQRMLDGWNRAIRKAMQAQRYRPIVKSAMSVDEALQADGVRRKQSVAIHNGQNLTGKEFGRLIAWELNTRAREFNSWVCVCACGGSPCNVAANVLLSGQKTDCGCVANERRRIAAHRSKRKRQARADASYKDRLHSNRLLTARRRERAAERRERSKRARLGIRRRCVR